MGLTPTQGPFLYAPLCVESVISQGCADRLTKHLLKTRDVGRHSPAGHYFYSFLMHNYIHLVPISYSKYFTTSLDDVNITLYSNFW